MGLLIIAQSCNWSYLVDTKEKGMRSYMRICSSYYMIITVYVRSVAWWQVKVMFALEAENEKSLKSCKDKELWEGNEEDVEMLIGPRGGDRGQRDRRSRDWRGAYREDPDKVAKVMELLLELVIQAGMICRWCCVYCSHMRKGVQC